MQIFSSLSLAVILIDYPHISDDELECSNPYCNKPFGVKEGSFWVHFNGVKHAYGSFCCHRCSLESMPAEYLSNA
jgi:hypothetical protein